MIMMTEKELIRSSALLCKRWNDLRTKIAERQAQLKQEIDAHKMVEQEAIEYFKNKRANFFISFIRIILFYLIIPCFPLLMIYLAYINGIDLDFMKEYGEYLSIVVVLLYILDGIIDSLLQKAKRKRIISNYTSKNISKYLNQNQHIRLENDKILSEIESLKIELSKLEERMNDREICCIHPDYWYAGSQLYYLIDCNRADNLKEAINLFKNIKENERRRLAEEAAAEERHWAKIEDMMNEGERLDKLKRTIRSAIDDAW